MNTTKSKPQTDAKSRKPQVPEGEIAIAKANPFEPIFNNTLRPKDATLATRGGGKGIWIYDEIERDCHVYAVLLKRKYALIGRQWYLDPASKSPADVRAAERVKSALESLAFSRMCEDLLDAILKGYAVCEVVWQAKDNMIVPKEIKARDQRRFVFDVDSNARLLTWNNLLIGDALPPRKFIVHRYGAKDGNPYGLGLGTRLFWPAWFKRQGLQFWLTFADKFGNPTPLGKYPPGADDDQKNALLQVLQSIANDTGIAIPDGMGIELLEAKRSGGANGVYDTMLKYLDDQIEEAVIVTTQTTSSRASGIGSQVSAIQNEVRLELTKGDAMLLAETLNKTLITWLTEFNDPDANPPQLYWDVEEDEDLKVRSDRDTVLFKMGYRLKKDAVTDIYGDFYDEFTPPAPTPGAPGDGTAPAFSEWTAADPAMQMTNRLAQGVDPVVAGWITKIRDLVNKVQSLDELRDELMTLYPQMSLSQYADAMTYALAAAQLAGRNDIMDEAGAGR